MYIGTTYIHLGVSVTVQRVGKYNVVPYKVTSTKEVQSKEREKNLTARINGYQMQRGVCFILLPVHQSPVNHKDLFVLLPQLS